MKRHAFIATAMLLGISTSVAAQDGRPEGMSEQDWANFQLRYHSNPTPPPVTISPTSLDWIPPTVDEYEETDTYPGLANGIKAPVLVRTANAADWFVDGKVYRHPYSYIMKVDGVALRNFNGRWHWCHRLVIIESPGDPQVGFVMYARLFASKANWTEVTR